MGRRERPVAGDLPEHVDGHTCIRHPGEAGVAEIVTPEVLVAELGNDLVPVSGVPEDGSGDAAPARAGDQARVGVVCLRTVRVRVGVTDTDTDTSPMRAAVDAAKITTSPQPSKVSAERSTRA